MRLAWDMLGMTLGLTAGITPGAAALVDGPTYALSEGLNSWPFKGGALGPEEGSTEGLPLGVPF
jgi:hypothetical protein